jgi:hypothetical protein
MDPTDADQGTRTLTEAEEQLAERLVADVARVLGAGLAIDDIEIAADGGIAVQATVLSGARVQAVEARGGNTDEVAEDLIRQAAGIGQDDGLRRVIGGS